MGRHHMHMHAQARAMSIHGHMAHTPSNEDVPPEVLPLGEEGNSQQGVKVEALHEQPEEACHDAVLEENHHGLAAHLWGQNRIQLKLQVESMGLITLIATITPNTCRPIAVPTDETKTRFEPRLYSSSVLLIIYNIWKKKKRKKKDVSQMLTTSPTLPNPSSKHNPNSS